MSEPTWEVTEQDRVIARIGLENQLRINQLDVKDSVDLKIFVENQVEVIASYIAQCRFLQNIVNGYDLTNIKKDI